MERVIIVSLIMSRHIKRQRLYSSGRHRLMTRWFFCTASIIIVALGRAARGVKVPVVLLVGDLRPASRLLVVRPLELAFALTIAAFVLAEFALGFVFALRFAEAFLKFATAFVVAPGVFAAVIRFASSARKGQSVAE